MILDSRTANLISIEIVDIQDKMTKEKMIVVNTIYS